MAGYIRYPTFPVINCGLCLHELRRINKKIKTDTHETKMCIRTLPFHEQIKHVRKKLKRHSTSYKQFVGSLYCICNIKLYFKNADLELL